MHSGRIASVAGSLLAATSALLVAAPPGAAADEAAWLFRPDHVTRIDLRLPAASRAALAEDPDEYVRGRFVLRRADGGVHGPLVVGVRLKGHASFRTLEGKAAFKLKFGEYVEDQRFQGLETMVLNNMVQDPTMLHELLAYKAFRAVGLPAWRTGYSFVRVNGRAFGVYLNLESPDEVAVGRRHPQTTHLYEAEGGVDVVPGAASGFDVAIGDEDDRQDLEALIGAVAAWSGVDAVADLEQMTRFWAVERYIGHWDSASGPQPNNFYLHSDAAGRFTLLPWGTDQTFRRRLAYDDPGSAMFDRCLADPDCEARYRRSVAAVRERLGQVDLSGLATRTAARLERWQRIDPRREHKMRRIRFWTAELQRFLEARRAEATTAVARR